MRSIACASVSAVSRFATKNNDFQSRVCNGASDVSDIVNAVLNECFEKINEYKALSAKAEGLLNQARQAEAKLKAAVKNAQSKAASTPENDYKISTSSDGKRTVKEVPNPAYAAAVAEVNKLQAKLSKVSAVVQEILRESESIKNALQRLNAECATIQEAFHNINNALKEIQAKSEQASRSLSGALAAIDRYLHVKIRLN